MYKAKYDTGHYLGLKHGPWIKQIIAPDSYYEIIQKHYSEMLYEYSLRKPYLVFAETPLKHEAFTN